MQNNVTELTQKLLRSLDSNYNVVDMPAVIEVISLLEKVAITKELLETTRLGKHVNDLRRNTTNESLAKRAKELVKKWRNLVLPDSNGQLKQIAASSDQPSEDVNLKNKKRPAKDKLENANVKRSRVNGQISELDFSDNSNSSFKDVINSNSNSNLSLPVQKREVLLINSDSNSSMPDVKLETLLGQQQPKKRGRKKGSKNHKSLIVEAETSFTNKMAVSRGNAKVKTTQELLADLQNRTSSTALITLPGISKPIEDMNERAAKLTERVSIIDQKLNTNLQRYKNAHRKQRNSTVEKTEKVIESGSFSNLKSMLNSGTATEKTISANSSFTDDDIIIVDDVDEKPAIITEEKAEEIVVDVKLEEKPNVPTSLSVEDALTQLPPVDKTCLQLEDDEPSCSCSLKENKGDFSIEDEPDFDFENKFEFIVDANCRAKQSLEKKYNFHHATDDAARKLHDEFIANVNGNFSIGISKRGPDLLENGLYVNVVPNVNIESIPKNVNDINAADAASENFKKYSISDSGIGDSVSTDSDIPAKSELQSTNNREDIVNSDSNEQTFKEWHEVVDVHSYSGEILKILPYVIID